MPVFALTSDCRGTRFTLSRDELLTLPEFVLLSLFPNGLLPEGHMNSFHEGDIYPVDVRPLRSRYIIFVMLIDLLSTIQNRWNTCFNSSETSRRPYPLQVPPQQAQHLMTQQRIRKILQLPQPAICCKTEQA